MATWDNLSRSPYNLLLAYGFNNTYLHYSPWIWIFCNRLVTSESARVERIKVSGNPSQYDTLDIFIDEQVLMRQLIADSILPTLEIDISDDNVLDSADKIADWLEETGGLWMADDVTVQG